MKRSAAFVMVSMVLAAAAPLWAQTTTGRLIGTVVDEPGAVLPEVVVNIASPALIGGSQNRVTNDGGFSFLLLPPGDYTVTASLAGFIT